MRRSMPFVSTLALALAAWVTPASAQVLLDIEPPAATVATVGAVYRVTAAVTNNSPDFLDARLHWDVRGPARARAWSSTGISFCSGTGYTPATDTSTVDCGIFSIAPGETLRAFLDIGALAPGALKVTATASSLSGGASDSANLSAVAGGGADLEVFAFTMSPENAVQHWLNGAVVTVVNNGPGPAADVGVRFSLAGLPATWFRLSDNFVLYRDLGFGSGSEPEIACAPEAAGDFVCRISALDVWQEATLDASWFTDAVGAATLAVDVFVAGDPDPTDNSRVVPITVVETPLADLSTTHALLTPSPKAGSPLEFEWLVHNGGPSAATALGFWGALGVKSFEVVSSPVPHDCFLFTEVICRFFDLPPGETAIVRIRTEAPSGGDYVSLGQVVEIFPERFDPVRSNNEFLLSSRVSGPMPTISREVVALAGAVHIPCIPGDGFATVTAQQRTHERLQTRLLQDGTTAGFLHSNLAWRGESGTMTVTTKTGEILSFALERGHQRASDRVFVKSSKSFGEDLRQSEQYTWIERRPDGSEGMTVTWRITLRFVQDELGRFFEVLDRSEFQCRR